MCVRWYAAYPLSFRNIEEMMAERGVLVDHSTLHRWSMKILPVLAAALVQIAKADRLRWRFKRTAHREWASTRAWTSCSKDVTSIGR